MSIKTLTLALAATLTLLAGPGRTQAALSDLVQIEVLDGGMTISGTHIAALKLTLADGWKTYWRAPGNAGIPPQFAWRGGGNLGSVAVTWPTPVVFDQGGLRSIGYKGGLVLPLTVTPKRAGKPLRLAGEIEFGICREVCIPARLDFARALNAAAPRNPAIAAALADRPYSAREAGLTAATCRIDPAPDGLRITARLRLPHTGGAEFAVFEPGLPQVWASEAAVRRQGETLTATSELIHIEGKPFALDRTALRITVLGASRAVDIRGCPAD